MNDVLAAWWQGLSPAGSLPTVRWSLLLAAAALAGHLVHRLGVPKVVGYAIAGAFAGLLGFPGATWPLRGLPLFLLELGVAVVLFEAAGRTALRWLWHNPQVLLQSVLEAALTYAAVYYLLRLHDIAATVAEPLAAIAIAASPAVLSRVMFDTRASGPVTDRALTLTSLGVLYAVVLVSARTRVMGQARSELLDTLVPIGLLLGASLLLGAVLALALRGALHLMNPASENTSILLLMLISAATAAAAALGASAALAALLAGLGLKMFHRRPWAWPRQLGTAASLLVMLSIVLVSVVAAQAPWDPGLVTLVLGLVAARAAGKLLGVTIANPGSGLSWRQAAWTALLLSPMSSVALLLVAQVTIASPAIGAEVAAIALPAILLMETLGAIVATLGIYRCAESSRAQSRQAAASWSSDRDAA